MTKFRTAITGLGCVSPAGLTAPLLWEAAVAGRSAVEQGVCRFTDAQWESLRARLATSAQFGAIASTVSRSLLLSLVAFDQATRQAGWGALEPTDGLILATTTGDAYLWEGLLLDAPGETSADVMRHEPFGTFVEDFQEAVKARGPVLLVSSACAASTQGLAIAHEWLQNGKVKRCLVGGVEVLCRLLTEGFGSFQLTSSERATPFDAYRRGINLAEGSGFVALEGESAKAPLAHLLGAGMGSDAFHMTSPHDEGRGIQQAIRTALEGASIDAKSVDWIHAHGTGSIANDRAEAAAFHAIFAGAVPEVCSTKGIHGHGLAASGAIETTLCVQALQHSTRLPTLGFQTGEAQNALHVATTPTSAPLRYLVKSSLGFGGANAAVVLGGVEA